ERARERDDAPEDPHEHRRAHRSGDARDVRRRLEDAGADCRVDDDEDAEKEADLAPQRRFAAAVVSRHARCGMRTPLSRATDSAVPCPAPAWRTMPTAGWTVSPRSSLFAAASVPSATMTMPACSELPMPTPPPWWKLTHDAPPAQLARAFKRGQSAMASEPSFMASVSRKGDATEPQSRWSRPMTMGAFTLPERTSSLKASPTLARSP